MSLAKAKATGFVIPTWQDALKEFYQEAGWKAFASEHVNEPVYISIDKDVLDPSSAITNWDQGSLTLSELEQLLAVVFRQEQVIGIDICGECPATLNLFEEMRETEIDNRANGELLRFFRSFEKRQSMSEVVYYKKSPKRVLLRTFLW